MDGRWLEVLNRYEKRKRVRHYSVFTFGYDSGGLGHPFKMAGRSYRSNGEDHSQWGTRYLQIESPTSEQEVSLEYIYYANIKYGELRCGYGVSRFGENVRGRLVQGSGFYLAVEEKEPYYCDYELERIDDDRFLQFESEREFVRSLGDAHG